MKRLFIEKFCCDFYTKSLHGHKKPGLVLGLPLHWFCKIIDQVFQYSKTTTSSVKYGTIMKWPLITYPSILPAWLSTWLISQSKSKKYNLVMFGFGIQFPFKSLRSYQLLFSLLLLQVEIVVRDGKIHPSILNSDGNTAQQTKLMPYAKGTKLS